MPMNREDSWDKVVRSSENSMSSLLGEMGYKQENGDFMVINMRNDRNGFKVDRGDGNVTTMGGWERKELPLFPHARTYEDACKRAQMTDQDYYDKLCVPNGDGQIQSGVTGSNNGVYAAYSFGSKEMVVTKNPEIIRQLEKQLCFQDIGLGVPFSNGDKPKDFQKAMEWEQVKRCSSNCKVEPKRILTDKEKAEAKKREEWLKSLMPKEEQKPAASSNPLRDAALNRQGRGY